MTSNSVMNGSSEMPTIKKKKGCNMNGVSNEEYIKLSLHCLTAEYCIIKILY